MPGDTPSRRDFLSLLGASGIIGLSGCSETAEDPKSTSKVADSATRTPASSATLTTIDDMAPSIIEHEALPEDNGTKLNVLLRGEDNRAIAYAAIGHGDRILETEPGEPEVELEGVLEDIPDAEPSVPGQVVYTLRDAAGNETEKSAYADENAPTVFTDLRATENAGELEFLLEGQDEVGLHELRTALNGEPVLTEDLTGQKKVSLQEILTSDQYGSMTPGEGNTVEAELEDAMGNTTRRLYAEEYVREFDKDIEGKYDIGVYYQPQMGVAWKGGCIGDRKPAVGPYQEVIENETFNWGIDQMTGHKIGRLIYFFTGLEFYSGAKERLRTFLESDLVEQVEIQAAFDQSPFHSAMDRDQNWKEHVVGNEFPFVRDKILTRDNITTYEGRPMVELWGAVSFVNEDKRGIILSEWGSYDDFMNDIKSQLTVDGKEPFLVAGGAVDAPSSDEDFGSKLMPHFDATSNWFPGVNEYPGETYHWEDAYRQTVQMFKDYARAAEDQGIEFIPTAFPGFDDRGNDCWGPEGKRHIPRSQMWFRKTLDLAAEYATTDMINIATWNDWAEGTQIEPGVHEGTDYGTEYLQIVEDFQTPS